MGEPRSGTCEPWALAADLMGSCAGQSSAHLTDCLQFASDTLFLLSGRRFPGHCQIWVRPNARQTVISAPFRGLLGAAVYGVGAGWDQSWGWCTCNREERTGCGSLSEITLGVEPVVSVDAVKVNGATLDPARYRVDDFRWLVRLPDADGTNPGWPCCQRMDLADTQQQTWSVQVTYGRRPPVGGKLAAAALACELANAGSVDCQLPNRVTSIVRQGVTMQLLDPVQVFNDGLTGLPLVDTWIRSVNPNKLSRRARMWSPALGSRVRRTGT